MALLVAADFRAETVSVWCRGLELSDADVGDSDLALAISSAQDRIETECHDLFEAADNQTVNIDVVGLTDRLYLPFRTRAIDSVNLVDESGTLFLQDVAAYRLHSSLNSTGDVATGDFDWLDITPNGVGLSIATIGGTSYAWPIGVGTVRVVGDFGWSTPPGDIRLAIAMLVYDRIKPQSDVLRLMQSWATDRATFQRSDGPTGLPAVDAIIDTYGRPEAVTV